ncbi:MAG: hypothetical protein IKB44_03175, partial [Clostridia bacterium]|nr:hypothetical protein [Clostridia bacterium]
MSIITARLYSDTDIYSGPGESYDSIDHIHSDAVLNVYYSEGNWYYVSCSPDYLVFNTVTVYGYVHGSMLMDMSGTPNDNQTSTPHTGYEVTGYYGPDSSSYDVCATLPEDQILTVLWAEGEYFYVECVSDNDGELRRMYIPQVSVDAYDGMPMTYTESYSEVELVTNTTGYTGPGTNYEASGEVTTDWAISKLDGIEENGFVLIEHPGSGNRYKRVWVGASAVVIPDPGPVDPPVTPVDPDQPGGEGNEGGGDNTDEYVAMAITNNDSDIYSGPGEDYEIIDHIVAGETVGILSDEGNWCYIECPAG